MATTKKYVSLEKLGLYDEKIKGVISAGDAAALQSAKDYADGLAGNYEVAGAAATAKSEAIEAAKTYTDTEVNRVGEYAASVNGVAAQAQSSAFTALKDAGQAQALASNAMSKASNLESYVGRFTTDDTKIDTVVKYIDAKTSGIASDETVSALDARIAAVEGDYLKAADKTELAGDIADEAARADAAEKANAAAIKAIADDYLNATDKAELAKAVEDEAARATGVEEGLAARIKAVEDDYLKAADKTELQDNIDTLTGVVETLRDGIDAEKVDGVKDLIAYVEEHGTEVTGMKEDIAENADAIAANAKAISDHETLAGQTYATKTELANEKKALQDEIDADVKVVADDLAELAEVVEGLGESKADASALAEAVEALEGADAGQVERIAALEAKFGDGEGNVESQIAAAKQEAIAAAAGDATTKANKALEDAKTYADGLNTAMDARVDALEAIDHDHSNKAELDLIASGDKAKWDAAAAKAHEHANMDVLAALTAAKVAAWDAALQSAKTYADGLNTAMDARMVAVEAWQANMVECSQEDINGLFA